MDVRCDRCQTEYELDDAIVTGAGASVQCTACGYTFFVRRGTDGNAEVGPIVRGAASTPPLPSATTTTPASAPPSALTTSSSLSSAAPSVFSDPAAPEWTLSTEDGKIHRFRELNTLQRWIVERKVTRADRVSRSNGPWSALGDIVDLGAFFAVVEEADRARALASIGVTAPSRPRSTSSSGRGSSSIVPMPGVTAPSAGMDRAASPARPATPRGGGRVLEDGPTVPNFQLPNTGPARASMTTPPAASPAKNGGGASTPPASPRATPSLMGKPRGKDGKNGKDGSGPRPSLAAASGPPPIPGVAKSHNAEATGPNGWAVAAAAEGFAGPPGPGLESPKPSNSSALSGTSSLEAGRTDHATFDPSASSASDLDFLRPPPRGRRALAVGLLLTLALVVAAAAAWWWGWGPGRAARQASAHPREPVRLVVGPPLMNAPMPSATSPLPLPSVSGATRDTSRAGLAASDRVAPPPPVISGPGPVEGPSPPPSSATARRTDNRPAGSSYERSVADADRTRLHGGPGATARAGKLYEQALAVRPDGLAALTGTGYVSLERHRFLEAVDTFRRATAIDPRYGPALFGIAESYRLRGDAVQALLAYRRYLAVAPAGADAPAARRQIRELSSDDDAP